MSRVLRDRRAILLFIVPGFILYTVLVILPVLWSAYYTFFGGMIGSSKWSFIGLDNYARLFQDKKFAAALMVNVRYIAMTTFGQVIFGLLLALMFKFWVKRFGSSVRTIVFFPVVLPVVAVGQLFTKIYEIQPYYGLLNSLLQGVGLGNLVYPWIGKADTALIALAAMDIWTAMGFYSIILYGALLDIPGDILEAAEIDGCNAWQLFRRILLPLLRPILLTCFVFSFTGTVKMFESALALTRGGPGTATTSLSMYMYNTAFSFQKTGYASVIALFIFLLCVFGARLIRAFDRKD